MSEASNIVISQKEIREALTYNKLSMLTVKCPSNRADETDLLRVVYHLQDIIGFSTILNQWFEDGKQKQKHIHLIIKKQYPSEDLIKKMSKSYKLKQIRYMEIVNGDPESLNPVYINRFLNPKDYTWHISEIKDEEHLSFLREVYQNKEKFICNFID